MLRRPNRRAALVPTVTIVAAMRPIAKRRCAVALVGCSLAPFCFGAPAWAAAPLRISGPTPFSHGCGTPGQPTLDSNAEPSLAVDPRDSRHIVVAWQRDRFNADGGANSNVVAVSNDGGHSFKEVTVGLLSRCTGGADERASDPWVTIGPDGAVYLASLTFSEMPQNQLIAGPTELAVSRSDDGGLTWNAPVYVVAPDNTYNDREQIIADPKRPGVVYFVWVKRYAVEGESGIEFFSKTTDGGRTWSAPAVAYAPPPGMLTDPVLLEVLPDGTLVNVALIANLTPFLPSVVPRVNWTLVTQRSTDLGQSWSSANNVASVDPFPPIEPATGKIVRAYPLVSTDVAPNGDVYLAWNDIPASGAGSKIFSSKSTDGAMSWSQPAVIASTPGEAFLPSIAVDRNGVVGVTYDDTRNTKSGHLFTDVWFSRSSDGGAHWSESHVAGPFDALTAPESDSSGVQGLFLGDYQGLAGLSSGFAAAFAQSRPAPSQGPSDMYFSALTPTQSSTPLAAERLSLAVTPATARAGRRTRFTFHVSGASSGQPIAGARIVFEGRRLHSDRAGRARAVLTPHRPGLRHALALKPGLGTAQAFVRVIAHRHPVLRLQTR
jgi:hypothetical protein